MRCQEGNSKSGKDGATAEKGRNRRWTDPACNQGPRVKMPRWFHNRLPKTRSLPLLLRSLPLLFQNPGCQAKTGGGSAARRTRSQVTYAWSYSNNYRFRAEVIITNKGSEVSQDVKVHLPMLENNSPYQTTALQSTNFDVVSTAGRISTFHLGEIQPGESKSLVADYAITLRSVSIKSTNNPLKARQAYTGMRAAATATPWHCLCEALP